MFINNKYTNWYYNIINNAKNRVLTGYFETHHIIPKSLGGSDDKLNLVELTAREHFIVHKLLVKMTTGKSKQKMSYAYCLFFRDNPLHPGREDICFTSREYHRRKKLLSEASSVLHKNKKVKISTIEKMLESRRRNNKPYPELARQKHSENSKKLWENHRDKMLQAIRSETTRKKMSESHKGKDNLTKEKRRLLAENNSGANNARARKIVVTDPIGNKHYCFGNFQKFCKENNLPFSSMCHILHKTRSFNKGATVGWDASYIN